MHDFLALQIGFETVPDDTASAELPLQVLVLTAKTGFSLDPVDGWQPQMPALKSGGVWAESSTSVGRTLIAGEDGNVTETMRVTLGTGDPNTLYTYIVALNRFIETARQHWTTYYQVLPVYLKWKATCGAGYQYALIYNIDLDIEYNPGGSGLAVATLSVEREPYWRAIPPGSNPKRYYYEKNNLVWKKANAILDSGTDHFKTDTVKNREEWVATYQSELSVNYLEVSNIPGDAPALMCLTLRPSTNANYVVQKIFVGRSTKNTPLTDRTGLNAAGELRRHLLFVAANGAPGTDAARAGDTGAPQYQVTGVKSRMEVSFATSTSLVLRDSWVTDANWTLLRGKFAVLLRMRQVGGSFGQITVQLQFVTGALGTDAVVTLTGNPTIVAGTGNTAGWPLTYLGDITIPIVGRAIASSQGYGESVADEAGGRIDLYASRSSGTGVLYLCDLILLPIDEGLFSVEGVALNSGAAIFPGIVDASGYLSRGIDEALGFIYSTGTPTINDTLEIKGNIFGLQPGVTNRLYFLTTGTHTSVADRSDPNHDMGVLMNIVPRWRGVRDV